MENLQLRNVRVATGWSVLMALVVFVLAGCGRHEEPSLADTTARATVHIASKPVPGFDASRAWKDISAQMAMGPRVPNTAAHDKAVAYIEAELRKTTDQVMLQSFDTSGYHGTTLHLTNVIASFNPSATHRILLLTHFDSRPWADQDPVKANHSKPVPAANDGASGTAVMLEMARAFKDNPPPIGVDMLFDDGEDYGIDSIDNLDKYFIGVKHFMATRSAGFHPMLAILLDMVGDSNARFQPEGNSMQSAPQYVRLIWRTASQLGLSHFNERTGQWIEDDHLPLIAAGIPSVDLIDADLVGAIDSAVDRKYWHTTDDVMKHLSPATLDEVGKLLLTVIYDRLPKMLSTNPS